MVGIRRFLYLNVPLYFAALLVGAMFAVALFFAIRLHNATLSLPILIPNTNGGTEELQYGSIPALANEDFFNSVRERFVRERASFIEANLSEMMLRYYDKGLVAFEAPIKTKGKEGSWWETPAGLYKVESKEKNHFSGFAKVYLPWSLPFQGNFFIHGWPYYKDGTPVDSAYSGGCIRLATEDAEKLYKMVKVGTPVLVFEKDFVKDSFHYEPGVGGISATAYLSADLKNNYVFAERASREPFPIASLTKLMTALVAVEYINIERVVTVAPAMLVPTSKPRLKEGERYSIYDLLHPLLLESSNEAAEAIAGYLGRERFIALMNQKANAIGMNQTALTDPSGRDRGNVSTAQDLFALAKYLYNNRSFILKMSAGDASTRTYGPPAFANIENYNVFGDDPEFVGGKVGMNGAGETILSVFESELGGETRPFVIVALGSSNRAVDAARLLTWTKDTY